MNKDIFEWRPCYGCGKDIYYKTLIKNCGHEFCPDCLRKWFRDGVNLTNEIEEKTGKTREELITDIANKTMYPNRNRALPDPPKPFKPIWEEDCNN